jgi:hypothetical protein
VNELMKWEHYSSPFKKDLLDVSINTTSWLYYKTN